MLEANAQALSPRTSAVPLAGEWPRVVPGVLVLLTLLILSGLPVALVVWSSFDVAEPGQPIRIGLEAWRTALTAPGTLQTLWNSLVLSITRVGLGTMLAIFFVWLIVRTNLPGRNVVEFLLWLAFFLPALPVTLGWILLLDPGYGLINQAFRTLPFTTGPLLDIYSFAGIVLVHVTLAIVPATVILISPAFRMLDASLEESAVMSGANRLQVIARVTLPVLTPAIVSAMLLSLIRTLESFEVEQVLGTRSGLYVFPTAIYTRLRAEPPEWGVASAQGSILLVLLVVILAAGRFYLGGQHYVTLGGRGLSRTRVNLGKWRWPAFVFCLLFACMSALLPLGMLLAGTFLKLYGFFTIADPFTLLNWQRVMADPLLLAGLRNSLVLGLGASVIGTLLMAVLAYALARGKLALTRPIEVVAWLPWCVPGILLGLGLLWAFLSNPLMRPLYGSMAGLIIALIIKEMPLALQMMRASVLQISQDLEHAAALSGASWHQTFRSVVFPLLAPTAASVMVLTFMAAVRDVSTVVLLATPSTTPLSLLVLQYSGSGSLESAAVLGVITSGLVIMVAVLARWLGLRMALQ